MQYKVLIAGDSIKSITLLRKQLEVFTLEFKVTATIDITTCAFTKSEELPDLIILHYDDTINEGICALNRIRDDFRLSCIPVLMTTDFVSSEIQKAIISGADDFIKKPIERVELMIRIKYLIQRNILFMENQKQSAELKKLSLVADRSENSVLFTNREGKLEWVNKAFEKFYGFTLEEFRAKYGADLGAVSDKFSEAVSECMKIPRWIVYENTWITRSGEKKWIQTSLTPLIGDNNEITDFIAVETDITRLKLAEERLKDQNQDLVNITVSVEQINKKLEEQQKEVIRQKKIAEEQKILADNLLNNIFPYEIAEQLKIKGYALPKHYKMVTIMFTDFVGFPNISDQLSIHDLIKELSTYFEKFDEITKAHYIEKIKTIGDSYMCAGGLPLRNRSNPIDTALAALEIRQFIIETNIIKEREEQPKWDMRLGIHTGEVIAAVIGKSKMAYDIWGNAVNTASRMETSGGINKINISGSTYSHIRKYFDCSYRGKVEVRNMGLTDMYYLNRLKTEFSEDNEGIIPNDAFKKILAGF